MICEDLNGKKYLEDLKEKSVSLMKEVNKNIENCINTSDFQMDQEEGKILLTKAIRLRKLSKRLEEET